MKLFALILLLLLTACGSNSPSTPAPTPAPISETTPPQPPASASTTARAKPAFMLETKSLYTYRTGEISQLTTAEVQARNDSDIASFARYNPGARAAKKTGPSISLEGAEQVIRATYENPIVSPYSMKYKRPGVQIGYCFGRATFAHVALKKMGVQTDSIRKVWLVGPMKTPTVKWGFHVATAVFVDQMGWQVLDSNLGRAVSVRAWYDRYRSMSEDGRLRIYFTSPTRFGVSIPRYERVDLGLDLSAERDWYQHYFYDLMAWFRAADFKAMGLDRVPAAKVDIAPNMTADDDIYATRGQSPSL